MVCDAAYESHPWMTVDGRRVCPECGLADLTSARLRRDVLARLAEHGIEVRPIDPDPP